jgi:hypothetical protein
MNSDLAAAWILLLAGCSLDVSGGPPAVVGFGDDGQQIRRCILAGDLEQLGTDIDGVNLVSAVMTSWGFCQASRSGFSRTSAYSSDEGGLAVA